jgi:formylglycine-generating enzyme required for sulfatase activity
VSGKIFINYRRKQSLAEAQHLATILSREFGERRVFIDVRGIDGFSNWLETLKQEVEGTSAMISVVGRGWLAALDREEHPSGVATRDFVRFEIAEALRRKIPVLPVLLDDAELPKSSELPIEIQGIWSRQAIRLHGDRFPEDAAAISKKLKKILKEAENSKGLAPWMAAALSAAAFAAGVTAPAALTRLGVIERSSESVLREALEDAKTHAAKAEARYWVTLRERDRAVAAKEAAGNEARAAIESAESERSKREAADRQYGTAVSELDRVTAAKDKAKIEARAASELASSEILKRERAEARLAAAEQRLAADVEEALKPQEDFQECADCPRMVVIPAGNFWMGSDDEAERFDNEGPRHKVTFSRPFAVGVYAVTFSEWDACVAAGGCGGYTPSDEGWGRGDRPVINVSWKEARAYVAWLSKHTRAHYRLLSEAEREYAARAGTSTPFWWGSSITPKQANYDGNYVYAGGGSKGAYCQKTLSVRSFTPNPWGLYQVHGNVWEWVEDCWHANYDGAPPDGSAWAAKSCDARVLRGGYWFGRPQWIRAASRAASDTGFRSSYVGFRVARTLLTP